MSELRSYFAKRRSEIQAQIKALKAELRDIDIADQALGSNQPTESKGEGRSSRNGKITIKDMVIQVLTKNPDGKDSNGLIKEIEAMHGIKVQRPSLSPQLSRLKEERRIILDGSIWRLNEIHDKEREIDPMS